MKEVNISVDDLIAQARSDPARVGQLLDYYRPYLVVLSQNQIGPKLAVRCDPDDIVQETMADAHRGFPNFRGASELEFTAWIKQIHYNNLRDKIRTIPRPGSPAEGPIDDANEPPDDATTASRRVIRGENALRLAHRLQQLPETQCEAIRLRYFEGLQVQEIAERMGKTISAAAGLIKRGLQGLRDNMNTDSWL
jgi:RNA polymerase sigma-70 factor, ECF subfamily